MRVAAALQALAPLREQAGPILCARLMQAAVEPHLWTGANGTPCPVFILHLAAAWKLTEAHPLVVALLRLPPEQCDAVLGDFITEGARQVLADTFPGNLRAIEALALAETAYPYARGAALDAATLLAVRGAIPREDALGLLTRAAALPLDPDNEDHATFADQIVSASLDLRAWELRGTITDLFERDLASPGYCGDIDEVLDELEPGAAPKLDAEHRYPPPITDAWEEVKDWHFFDDLHPEAAKARRLQLDRAIAEAAHARLMRDRDAAAPLEPHTVRRETPKVGRNAPCPCGSGKKFKKCCGA